MTKTIDDIRAELQKIDLLDTSVDIHVLCYPPGIGKSTTIRNFCNNHPEISKIGISSARHNFLEETSKKVKNFEQWYGLDHQKSRCTKKKQIKWQLNLGLHSNTICVAMGCDTKKCPHHQQFAKKQRSGFPTNYLETRYVEDFDIIFIEESITELNEYIYEYKKFIECLAARHNLNIQ